MIRLSNLGFFQLVPSALALVLMLFSGASAFEAKKSNENMVTVEVKPVQLAVGKGAIFQVSLTTHSVDLSYDMEKASLLQDSEGRIYSAAKWQGSPPGGHHRSGTLEFPAVKGNPRSVKLVMKGISDVPDRSFEWKLGAK